ncbi:MAG TPA: hypothetical protein VL443_23945 [Cyclobacteriaceae bacterium]|jgi:hypothetical protein|nr:hypothetical protein [Cyclobacteriaceae bacterium]
MKTGNSNMNSTNQVDDRIRKVFDAMTQEVKSGKTYFPLHADASLSSYYEKPQHEAYAYFSFIDTKDREHLLTSFNELWKANQELKPVASAMCDLAFDLREIQGEQSTDLSPFVYTLY